MNMKTNKGKLIFFIASILFSLAALVLFILSCSVYKDSDGTSIDFNKDYLMILIIGVETLSYSIAVFKNHKAELIKQEFKCLLSLEVFAYTLGVFFKAMAKHKEFKPNLMYLLIGVIGLVFFIGFLIELIDSLKTNKEANKEAE